MIAPAVGSALNVGPSLLSVKIKLFPSLDLVRVYPGRFTRSGFPLIPPTAVNSVQDAPVPIGGLFTDNCAPASKVMLPVVVATTLGTVGAGMATIGVIA